MRLRFLIIFLLSFLCSIPFKAQTYTFEQLKGKKIILPIPQEHSNYVNRGERTFDCFFSPEALVKKKFKKEFLLTVSMFNRPVIVEDVVMLNPTKESKRAVAIVLNDNEQTAILYIPLCNKYPFSGESMCITTRYLTAYKEVARFTHVDLISDFSDVSIPFFDLTLSDSISSVYSGKIIYPIQKTCGMRQNANNPDYLRVKEHEIVLGYPYTFNGIFYDSSDLYRGISNSPSVHLIDYCGNLIQFPLNAYSAISSPSVQTILSNYDSMPSVESFSEYFIESDSLISQSIRAIDNSMVDSFRDKFFRQEIYFEPQTASSNSASEPILELTSSFFPTGNTATPKGYFNLIDIRLLPSVKHKPYLFQYAIISDSTATKHYGIPLTTQFMDNSFEIAQQRRSRLEAERQEIEQARIERERQVEREEQIYKNTLIRKYGRTNATLILDGVVKIGFTKPMCEEAWGEPYDISRVTTQFGTAEAWWYGNGIVLYFSGNKLVIIQN